MLIVYRACNSEADGRNFKQDRPEWFNKKNCFKSLLTAMDFERGDKDKLVIIFDGDPNTEYAKVLKENATEFINVNYQNGPLVLMASLEYAKNNHTDQEYIYFIEDDYLHHYDAMKILREGMNKFGRKHPITLYDHLDRYTRDDDITKDKESILISDSTHWRTSESTTCTICLHRDMLNKTYDDFRSFQFQDRELFRYLISKYNIRVLTSLPGRATHVNKYFFAPFTDWKEINDQNEYVYWAPKKKKLNFCYMTVHDQNNCQEVVDSLFADLDKSGLINELEKIFIFSDDKDNSIKYPELGDKLEIIAKEPLDYEFPALIAIKKYCDAQSDDIRILYIHSKGSSHLPTDPKTPHIKDWLKLMSHFNIYRYKDCWTALDMGDACGVNAVKTSHIPPHFSGNFWWANSAHIKRVLTINTERSMHPGFELRFNAEFWIGSLPGSKLISLFNSNTDHYHAPFPESKYEGIKKVDFSMLFH